MGVGLSTLDKWVRKLKNERDGQLTPGNPITPEQREIAELKKQIKRLELEKEILKKASALLMSDSMNGLRLPNSLRELTSSLTYAKPSVFIEAVLMIGLNVKN
jgi:transposase